MKKAILEGCNGDWAHRRYLPALVRKVIKNQLDLTAVDIVSEPVNISGEQWNEAANTGKARYLNKATDRKRYEAINDVDCVFIVTPPEYHCETAAFWLPRMSPEGRIFIEKPLDTSSKIALSLKKENRNIEKTVYAFDHYLARAMPFLNEKTMYLAEIGDIKKIVCRLLSPYPIEPERIETLEQGVIFDLLSHILPIVVRIKDTLNPESIGIIKSPVSRVARYTGCPIPGESFALIEFEVGSVPVSVAVGYYIKAEKNKAVLIHGEKGTIELNLAEDFFSVYKNQEGIKGGLEKNHVESFLESVLQDDASPLDANGVMNFDTALEILIFLEECKEDAKTMPDYTGGISLEDILQTGG